MSNATAYSGQGYSGQAIPLDAGPQELSTINVGSIRVPFGWRVTLYGSSRFSGISRSFTTDTPQVPALSVASAVVEQNAVFYRITPTHSQKALDVSGASQDNRAHVIQYQWSGNNNQRFLLIRDDDGFYTVSAYHSGKVLDIALNGQIGLVGHLIQYQPHGRDNQKFRITANNAAYRVDAKHSGKVWDVDHASNADGTHIFEYNWNGGRNQQFLFQAVETVPLPVRQGREPNDIGDVPRLTSFTAPPAEGPRVLIGETWIPYFLISDGQTPDSVKVKYSPFYRLSRYSFWKLLYYFDFDSGVDMEQTFTYETGLTVGNTVEVETVTGWTLGAEASLKFLDKWVPFKITGTVTRSTKTTVTNQVQLVTKTVNTQTRKYAAGPRMAEAAWARADLFVLTRTDGTEVLSWQIVDDKLLPIDRYPGQ